MAKSGKSNPSHTRVDNTEKAGCSPGAFRAARHDYTLLVTFDVGDAHSNAV
jgi:hypothetical protein